MRRATALLLLIVSAGLATSAFLLSPHSDWNRLYRLLYAAGAVSCLVAALLVFFGEALKRKRRDPGPIETVLLRMLAVVLGLGALYVFIGDVATGRSLGKKAVFTVAGDPMMYFLSLITMSSLGVGLLWFAAIARRAGRPPRGDPYLQMRSIHRSLAWLYAVLAVAVAAARFYGDRPPRIGAFSVPLLLLVLAVVQAGVARACRARVPGCRLLSILMAVPMFLGWPAGTLLAVHVMYECRKPWRQ